MELSMDGQLIFASRGAHDFRPTNEIFIVDDDEDTRELLTAALAPQGLPVATFADGEAFLKAAGARTPICIFLDVVMPGLSGIQILKELNAQRYCAPIFLMSARDDSPTIVDAIKSGAQDYITKPFERNAPALRVRDAIEFWRGRELKTNLVALHSPESCQWLLLTPHEQEIIAMTRKMTLEPT
jgi:FixJ family two-component response regulator